MSTTAVGTLTAGAGKVGRYFTVVSAIPAALFSTYAYLVVQVGWSGPVQWSSLGDAPWYGILLAGLGGLALALTLNPLQFPLIQFFEGYWGNSGIGAKIATMRILRHRRRVFTLEKAESSSQLTLAQADPQARDLETVSPDLVRAAFVTAESQRALGAYPDLREILPTRLGNVLRRYERSAGRSYGINPIIAVPRLAMVATDREIAYLQNQRVQLELALRTSLMGLLATVLTVAVMTRHGMWLLLALVPYSVAYLSYRGAVALAHEYGTSVMVLIDLSRLELYRRMGLKQPESTEHEREMNTALMKIFTSDDDVSLPYEEPSDLPPPAAQVAISVQPSEDE
ncbi:hypothetical protein UK23_35510 [Lentzea aerocolonigenes]|uniref:Uncharacterized protein n=1 Tax=Lentzea aerocolonigenes TaxID=68170 RepID=A0A0F0GHG5_LENAE|nr:hypothetical protein [Lentzea aerocolonigenes]KJK42825.1 hypothetical protein UK23_35510 [Lentzea aerocolonigenes]